MYTELNWQLIVGVSLGTLATIGIVQAYVRKAVCNVIPVAVHEYNCMCSSPSIRGCYYVEHKGLEYTVKFLDKEGNIQTLTGKAVKEIEGAVSRVDECIGRVVYRDDHTLDRERVLIIRHLERQRQCYSEKELQDNCEKLRVEEGLLNVKA